MKIVKISPSILNCEFHRENYAIEEMFSFVFHLQYN
jgi:hypothetical protein